MKYLTEDKLVIVGAAGMIGSNMAQCALMLGLTPNLCLYDVYEPGLKGVLAEINHCAFPEANVTATADPAVAFKDAKYIISSGGAPRKEGNPWIREMLYATQCPDPGPTGPLRCSMPPSAQTQDPRDHEVFYATQHPDPGPMEP